MSGRCAVLFDVDGTLVDSNYFHTIAWFRAFQMAGRAVEMTAIHRAIGMGSEEMVEYLASGVDPQVDDWRQEQFRSFRGEIRPTPGACDLVRAVATEGALAVYATSGKPEDIEHMRSVIGADPWVHDVVNSSEVDSAKPEPDIFRTALYCAGVPADRAIVVGDSVWDVVAARRCGVECVGLMSGGISGGELIEAGAIAVYRTPQHLLDELRTSPVGALLVTS